MTFLTLLVLLMDVARIFLELTLGKNSEFQGLYVSTKSTVSDVTKVPIFKTLMRSRCKKQVAACGSNGENYISVCCL